MFVSASLTVCSACTTLTLWSPSIPFKFLNRRSILYQLAITESGLLLRRKWKDNYLFGNGNLKLMFLSNKAISLISIAYATHQMVFILQLEAMMEKSSAGPRRILFALQHSMIMKDLSQILNSCQKKVTLF